MLEFEVKNQKLTRVDVVEPATDSEQYLKAKFTIKDADWNGKTKTALFRLGDAVYKALLDSNNVCIVPSEVLIRNESKYARTQTRCFRRLLKRLILRFKGGIEHAKVRSLFSTECG